MRQTFKVMLLLILASGILATGCSTPVEAPEIGKAAQDYFSYQ